MPITSDLEVVNRVAVTSDVEVRRFWATILDVHGRPLFVRRSVVLHLGVNIVALSWRAIGDHPTFAALYHEQTGARMVGKSIIAEHRVLAGPGPLTTLDWEVTIHQWPE